jgi:type IV pilus assembly protein PilC
MSKFSYKAYDSKNRLMTGIAEGTTVDEVVAGLSEKGLLPTVVEELNFDGSSKKISISESLTLTFKAFQARVPFRQVVFFTRQLATMIQGGVPLARSLEQLAKAEQPAFKKVITQIADDISIGYSFSDAVARHPRVFDSMFISVIKAGEISGALDKVLDQLAIYMENADELKSKVTSAMRYPSFIGGFVLVLMIGIMWKLVPIFENIYGSFGAALPLPTQILVTGSHIVAQYIPIIILLGIGGFFGYKYLMTLTSVKRFADTMIFKVPVFGEIAKKNILANYSRTMSLLMESGTPILDATEICAGVVRNKMFSEALQGVHASLRSGDQLSTALEKTGVFPVLVTQLIATGEESGRIDELLRKAAEFYEREIRNVVDSMSSIIEPFLIVGLGSLVGSVIVALYLPVFMMGKIVK